MQEKEARLRSVLLQAVSRRRRQKKAARGVLVSLTLVIILSIAIVFDSSVGKVEIVPLAENQMTPAYTLVETRVVPQIREPKVQIEYVQNSGNTRFIPTEPLGVTIVTDTELEHTFSDRAYALSHDQNNRITAFHLLDGIE